MKKASKPRRDFKFYRTSASKCVRKLLNLLSTKERKNKKEKKRKIKKNKKSITACVKCSAGFRWQHQNRCRPPRMIKYFEKYNCTTIYVS